MKIRNIISILLMIIGVGLLLIEPYKNYKINNMVSQNQIHNISRDTIEQNKTKEVTFDPSQVSVVRAEDVIRDSVKPEDLPTVAGITIPSVNLNLPVYKGVSNEGLYYGAGTVVEGREFGKGNMVLASHHSIYPGMLFQPLSQVEDGAKVYVTDLTHVYEYTVNANYEVEETAVYIQNDTEEAILTLFTCTTDLERRTVVTADLTEKWEMTETPIEVLEHFNLKTTIPE